MISNKQCHLPFSLLIGNPGSPVMKAGGCSPSTDWKKLRKKRLNRGKWIDFFCVAVLDWIKEYIWHDNLTSFVVVGISGKFINFLHKDKNVPTHTCSTLCCWTWHGQICNYSTQHSFKDRDQLNLRSKSKVKSAVVADIFQHGKWDLLSKKGQQQVFQLGFWLQLIPVHNETFYRRDDTNLYETFDPSCI